MTFTATKYTRMKLKKKKHCFSLKNGVVSNIGCIATVHCFEIETRLENAIWRRKICLWRTADFNGNSVGFRRVNLVVFCGGF